MIYIAIIFSFLMPAKANLKEQLKKGLIQPSTSNPLINEVVEYRPIDGHHFNLEAPQDCGGDSSIKTTAKKISCQFHSDGEREVIVSVCDHKKTYCKQEKVKALVQKVKSTQSKIKESPSLQTLKMQKGMKDKVLSRFKEMTPDEAVQAIPMKKAALVMISAEWCPPCNQAKEFMLQTQIFKDATKNLLLIYVDGDSPSSEAWNQKLQTRYYPSFVVLNNDLERVSVFSDGDTETHIRKLTEALNNLNDPLNYLFQRVEERQEGGFLRKLKDLLYSEEDIVQDNKRYIEYLASVAKYNDVLTYLEKIEPSKEYDRIRMESYYMSSNDKDEEFLESFLNQDPSETSFYYYALKDYCEKTKKEEVFSKACFGYKENFLKSLTINESWPEEEKKLYTAVFSKVKARLSDFFGESNTQALYAQCVSDYNDLYTVTPLGKRSRSVRIEQIACLKGDSQSIEILNSLAEDYPFEETFHRKLAKQYAKKKQFDLALEYNQKAIDYSYGYMWIYNVAERANYLRQASKQKEALALVESAMSEVILNKEDPRVNSALKSLRAQYDALRVL